MITSLLLSPPPCFSSFQPPQKGWRLNTLQDSNKEEITN